MTENQQKWTAFKSGDEGAFSNLFHEHYFRLFQYGLKMVPEEALVKDVLQDFFLYLYENCETLADHVANPFAYLLTSFRRRLLREVTQQRKEHVRREDVATLPAYAFEIGPDDILVREETEVQNSETITRLLNELSPQQQEILYQKYYLDMSLAEIAEALSISYQVAANSVYRALKKLRALSRE